MSGLITKNRLIGLALAALIAVIDQAVKGYVTGPLGIKRMGDRMEIVSFFDLAYVENRGISLGMLEASSMEMRWLLVLMTAIIALVVFVWIMRERLLGEIIGLGMILGGAIGNIQDRMTYGYVIDYADLHVRWIPEQLCLNYSDGLCRPFLVFNIADAAITLGVVLILARALFLSEKGSDDTQDAAEAIAEK